MAVTGVTVAIAAQGTTAVGSTADSGTYFVVAQASQGPTAEPAVCRSYGEVERVFGPATSYSWLHADARCYFEEADGSGRMVILRVVGPSASTGFVNLSDRGVSGGSPTLKLSASSAGAWSGGVTVTVADGLQTNTVDVNIYLNGVLVENYSGLPTVTAIVQALNYSEYVVPLDLGSTAASAATALPAVTTSPVPLSAGADDRDNIVASHYTAGLALLTDDYGPGIVAIPGQPYSTVATSLANHASNTGREAIVCTPPLMTPSAAQAAARTLRTLPGSERLILPYPWVAVPDGAGGSVNVPPSGFVAGLRAKQCAATGPWDAPAGDNGIARYVVGTERPSPLTKREIDLLVADAVSPFRESSGAVGPRLYGYRALSANVVQWKFLTYAATLDLIAWELQGSLEQYVQKKVDGKGHLLQQMETTVENILAPIAEAGGLFARRVKGQVVDPGYRIRIDDDEINPPSHLEAGEVDVYVEVRLSPLAELIRVTLAKVTLTTAL